MTLDEAQAFVGVTPTRVLDTRQAGATEFGPGETRTLSFASHVPAEATSVALALVSPQGATALGYFTMWPSGQPRPETSVLNPVPSYDLATSALLRLGNGHGVDIYNAFGQSDLVVDLLGYFVPLADVEGLGAGGGPAGPQGPAGPAGAAGATILSDSGPPDAGDGRSGDLYFDTTSGSVYGPKTSSGWGVGTSLLGPQGPQGLQGLQGLQGPQGLPGAQGLQGLPGLQGIQGIAGAAGSQILSGPVPPLLTDGVDGDFFFDTVAKALYGPKTGGLWGAAISLVGPQGIQGIQGIQGPAGAILGDIANTVNGGGTVLQLLDNTSFQSVLTYTPPSSGNYMLQATIGAQLVGNPVLSVGTGMTVLCRWSNNPTVTFGASLTAGVTILAITVPGLNRGNIVVPGQTSAGAAVTLECQKDVLAAVLADVTITPVISAIEVSTLS